MSESMSLSRVSSLCDPPDVDRVPSLDRFSSLVGSFSLERMASRAPSMDRVSSLVGAFPLERMASRADRSSSLCFPSASESESPIAISRQLSPEPVLAPLPHARGPDSTQPKFDPALRHVPPSLESRPGLTALVLDCGIGQTRALVLTYRGGVSVCEARTAPAVVEFLGADDLRGSPLLQAVEGDAVHPFFFLDQKPPPSLTPVALQPAHFLQFVSEVREECKAEVCFIGTSQWYRDVNHPAGKLVEQLSLMGVVTQSLTRSQEASFECAAIQYACAELGLQDLAGSIGSGGGSVQCFRGKDNFNLEVGWRSGVDRLIQSGGGRAALHEFDLWWEDTVNPAFRTATSLLKPELKLKGSVLCTSACYYAAKLIGKASHSGEMRTFRARDVRMELQRKRQEILNLIRANEPIKDHAMDLCNLSLHIRILDEMVMDDAQLLYKRDWLLPGNREFRTTWTAGWYLFFLKSRGITFPSCDALLNAMAPTIPAQPVASAPAREPAVKSEVAEAKRSPRQTPANLLEVELKVIEDEIVNRVEAQKLKTKSSTLVGVDVSVSRWVESLGKLAQFAPLFAYTQWDQMFCYGLADLLALGLPLAAAVPLSKAVQQRRHSLLQDGSQLVGADWPLEEGVLSLCVGGSLFYCNRVTLLPSTRFRSMFADNPHKRHFFLDRDGRPFAWILSYLRSKSLLHVQDWDIFLPETEFFGLKLPSNDSLSLSFKVSNLTAIRSPLTILQSLAGDLRLGGYVGWSGLHALEGKILFPLDHMDVLGAIRSVRRLLGSWGADCLPLALSCNQHPMEFLLRDSPPNRTLTSAPPQVHSQ